MAGEYRPGHIALLNDPRWRGLIYQVLLLAFVLWLAYEFAVNAAVNLQARGIQTGFDFFKNTAQFGVSQSLIPYSEADTYGRVFIVGLLNTLLVSVLGIVFATAIGFVVGIGRLSPNWLIARIAGAYVEMVRNVPLLFHILFWYLAVLGTLPGPRHSIGIGWKGPIEGLAQAFNEAAIVPAAHPLTGSLAVIGAKLQALADWVGPPEIYLNNRGLILPRPIIHSGADIVVGAFILAIVASVAMRLWARRRHNATGRAFPTGWTTLGLLIGLPFLAMIVLRFPISIEVPQLRGFNFVGGIRLLPELVALWFALSTYTAAFIAEIVRAGILAVPRGQAEAAYSLGLRPRPTLRRVIVPQALRVIVPPLTSQYLNLIKNSSLAVAVGYPDLFAVFAGTTLNQTGQAIEIIAITMAVYLAISLVTSLLMNWYNSRVAFGGAGP